MDGHEQAQPAPLVPSIKELNADELADLQLRLSNRARDYIENRPDAADHAAIRAYAEQEEAAIGIEPTNSLHSWFMEPRSSEGADSWLQMIQQAYNADAYSDEPEHPARFIRQLREQEPEFFARCVAAATRSQDATDGLATVLQYHKEGYELTVAGSLAQTAALRWLDGLCMTDAARLIRQYIADEVRSRHSESDEASLRAAIEAETRTIWHTLTT